MQRTEHKDQNGNVISVSETYSEEEIAKRNEGFGYLILLGLVCSAVYYFFEAIAYPDKLSYPYNYFAKYYQLILYFPFNFLKFVFIEIWEYGLSISQYNNLNLTIACLAVGLYMAIIFKILFTVVSKFAKLSFYLLFGPGLIWFIYWLFELSIEWLFA